MLPGAQVELSPAAPPYRFADGEFDVVYLYSVFSHLNEPQFHAVLHEAARVVRTGGLIAFTTLSPASLPREFPETWAADAAAARFIHTPTGGGHDSMPASAWGWTMLSEPYLRRILPAFPLGLLAYTETSPQTFVALRKHT
jgi:SAM-dependent methyltransferase